jgi:hypothetical protein
MMPSQQPIATSPTPNVASVKLDSPTRAQIVESTTRIQKNIATSCGG